MNIQIPGYYIIRKTSGHRLLEQIAHISYRDGTKYYFDYGYFSNHEGNCSLEEIRELTTQEGKYLDDKMTTKLPQQFYQSIPKI